MRTSKVNKQKQDNLKIERVNELLEYRKPTGKFYWIAKSSKYSHIKIGNEAGGLSKKGYTVIIIDGVPFQAHRLAWFVEKSFWPINEIDHVNGIRDDNRIENLRDVSVRTNMENQAKRKRTDPILPMGVSARLNRRGELLGYRAHWQYINGKGYTEYFSLRIYGSKVAAIEAAHTYRQTRIAELNAQGANYTLRHGVE